MSCSVKKDVLGCRFLPGFCSVLVSKTAAEKKNCSVESGCTFGLLKVCVFAWDSEEFWILIERMNSAKPL